MSNNSTFIDRFVKIYEDERITKAIKYAVPLQEEFLEVEIAPNRHIVSISHQFKEVNKTLKSNMMFDKGRLFYSVDTYDDDARKASMAGYYYMNRELTYLIEEHQEQLLMGLEQAIIQMNTPIIKTNWYHKFFRKNNQNSNYGILT